MPAFEKIVEAATQLSPVTQQVERAAAEAAQKFQSFRADAIWHDELTSGRALILRTFQKKLSTGQVSDLVPVEEHGMKYTDVFSGRLHNEDNTRDDMAVIVRKERNPSHKQWTPDLIAQQLSPALFGTVVAGIERQVADWHGVGYVQPKVGESLRDVAAKLTDKPYGDLTGLFETSRKPIEEALVERGVILDSDPNALNFRALLRNQFIRKVYNIDLEDAFFHANVPFWMREDKAIWQEALANQPLLDSTSTRISDFLSGATRPEARSGLVRLGLFENDVDAMIARTRWFDKNRRFPNLSRRNWSLNKLDSW